EDVGGLAQGEQLFALLGRFQIEHHALLAAIEVAEEHRARPVRRTNVAARIALTRLLDLDHLRAMIRERHRQVRPWQERREIDDAGAFELHARTRVAGTGCAAGFFASNASLSAPSVGAAACSARLPSPLIGLPSTRKSARPATGTVRIIPVR